MIRRKLFLNENEIPNFINIARSSEGDVTIYRGKYAIDAKSLLGVVSIYSPDGLIIEYSEKDKRFEKTLQQLRWV